MSNGKLTPTSYLVLGSITLLGEATSYDLKGLVGLSIGHFWTFPHSQLYAEPARLAQMGLLSEDRERGGRRRRVYSITEEGRRELQEWLAEPETPPTELRDMGALKLFFGHLVSREDVVRLAKAQLASKKERLAEYEAIEARFFEGITGLDFQLAVLRCGIAVERAVMEFWTNIAENPPTRSAT